MSLRWRNSIIEYSLKCDPLNQTLEKQADIRQGFLVGVKWQKEQQDKLQQKINEKLADEYSIILYPYTTPLDESSIRIQLRAMTRETILSFFEYYKSNPPTHIFSEEDMMIYLIKSINN